VGFIRSPRSIPWVNGSHEVRYVPPRLFARCGLAGQPFCASCRAVQRRLNLGIRDGYKGQNEFFRSLLVGPCPPL